ncbi:ATP-binding protein [Hymenobacter aquaticus]|uniref:ATP-binding protein n=1 Tax=Hymenobacter aquaticus TaxID=1867101 RepID=A0A4Z0Q552_9BACT|nr:ATP-binding protein [Hymenobacter aquaticus]TGE25208.1 ATP-binding protein [Hymenobacter aquaticus]
MYYTKMSNPVSAAGERAAIGGYLAQFNAFAWFAYQELIADRLEWIRLADPDAEKLDDIQYATANEVHAYQVKWTIAGENISFLDFCNLLPDLVQSWRGLRAKYHGQHKQVIGHLLTNKNLSAHDRILSGKTNLGTFADFFAEAWLPIKAQQPYAPKWKPAVQKLARLSGLKAAEFKDFVAHFELQPNYKAPAISITKAGYQKLDDDVTIFRSHLLEQVGDASRPVELQASQLITDLHWEARFQTTFNHELFVDPHQYQPITATLQALDAMVDGHAGGYLFLAGAPGTGKSTLLTQWAKGRSERVIKYYAFDFTNPASPGNYHERGDSTTLYFDLVFQLKAAGAYGRNVLPYRELHYLREVFYQQLNWLGEEYARTGRKTILLLDGLDHVPREYQQVTKSFLRELPLPTTLPAGVYVVLGSQTYELSDLAPEIKAEWRQLDRQLHMAPLERHAVFRLAEAADLHPPLITAQQHLLADKSQGHPLYVTYLLERLRNSSDRDGVLAEATPIGNDITLYYQKIWEPIAGNDDLVTLLGLLARLNGSINLKFVREWGFATSVLTALRRQAKPLFTTTDETWSFFHNSFRQFLLQQTALDPLTGEHTPAAEAELHRQLAAHYKASQVEPAWNSLFHLYHAGDTEQFWHLATPAYFVDQFVHFRPDEEIKRDLQLGLSLARRTRDVVALARYGFALAELESRLRHIRPAAFVEEFLVLRRPDLARRCLRTGHTLLTNRAYALLAARCFFDYGEHAEASMLLALAEPAAVQAEAIVVDEAARFEEVQRELKEWVATAVLFQPLPALLTRLNNIQLLGKAGAPHETAVHLRFSMLEHLMHSLIDRRDWAKLDTVLAEFRGTDERRLKIFFDALRTAARASLADDNQEQAKRYLTLLVAEFPLGTVGPTPRVYVADLIYDIMADTALVEQWLAGVPQPTGLGQDFAQFDESLVEYEPFILLNKLLHLCGAGMPVDVAVSALPPGAEMQELVAFQRRVGQISQLLAEALAGSPLPPDLLRRVQPVVQFYYQAPSEPRYHQHRYWRRLLRLQSSYFALLISAVAEFGPAALEQLATLLLREFASRPTRWPADVRRSILVALVGHGYAPAQVVPVLRELEAVMLDGLDVDGRVTACRAQAQAWVAVADPAAAERLLQQALQEAAGVGFRKDYQLTTWLTWLQQVNERRPGQAPERLRWFLAHLQHLRDITTGNSFWSASETLLATTLAWNFSAGQRQLQWQLDKGFLVLDGALEVFSTSFLARATSAAEFGGLLRLFTDVYLLLSPADPAALLTTLLNRGFALLGEEALAQHLPALLDAVTYQAQVDKRKELLAALANFVAARGLDVSAYHPDIVWPVADAARVEESGNDLILRSEYERVPEASVLARASTHDELVALLAREDTANSYFDWSPVLMQLAPQLSAAQVRALAASRRNTRRDSLFYSALSGLAWRLGEQALARELAEQAIEYSTDAGWARGYDGGSRLRGFEALQRVDPTLARQRAFDVFSNDLTTASSVIYYLEELDDVLPVITGKFEPELIWDEVFGYVQRLFATSKPLSDVPELTPGSEQLETVLAELVGFLTRWPLPAVKHAARALLPTLMDRPSA